MVDKRSCRAYRGDEECLPQQFLRPEETREVVAALGPMETDPPKDLARITQHVHRTITYITDEERYGKSDFWQYPHETLAAKKGDCEDMAILLASILMEARMVGVRLVLGNYQGKGHAWVEVQREESTYLLDSTFGTVHDDPPWDYTPLFYIDREGSVSVLDERMGAEHRRVLALMLLIGLVGLLLSGRLFTAFVLLLAGGIAWSVRAQQG